LSYCPRSSLPARVLAWLAGRLAPLLPPRPPGQGGTPPLSLEVRLDAVAAVILDGLSYRRAGRAVGISKTEVGDSLDLLLGPLAALGFCQPDGTFITSLDNLRHWLAEMAAAGEAVVVDGLATRVQRPAGWANQKVVYDAKRHTHTAQGLAISTIHGDLLWCDGGWPGSWHEHELIQLAGLQGVLDEVEVASLLDRGSAGWPRRASTGTPRSATAAPRTASAAPSGPSTACGQGCARWWSRRSPTWPTPGRCAAGAGCCTGSGTSSAPPRRSFALAAGSTGSPHDTGITDTLNETAAACPSSSGVGRPQA
jgi:DDE superfamily endonuclease